MALATSTTTHMPEVESSVSSNTTRHSKARRPVKPTKPSAGSKPPVTFKDTTSDDDLEEFKKSTAEEVEALYTKLFSRLGDIIGEEVQGDDTVADVVADVIIDKSGRATGEGSRKQRLGKASKAMAKASDAQLKADAEKVTDLVSMRDVGPEKMAMLQQAFDMVMGMVGDSGGGRGPSGPWKQADDAGLPAGVGRFIEENHIAPTLFRAIKDHEILAALNEFASEKEFREVFTLMTLSMKVSK
ncbi:hypothetical protein HK097_002529 [Rhizophlyctis rosea]|uniref:Uncharacterized protein n=1 Tax=Rhizophlyctis rosea TaxID=64517 RepID=A0AAD5SGD8_9FUNG|nr:hypothetical protein HK097_002529 [Rhizophlyctis rosea]